MESPHSSQKQTCVCVCVVCSMFMDSPEDERTKLVSCLGAFRQYWSSLPQVSSSSPEHTCDPNRTFVAQLE